MSVDDKILIQPDKSRSRSTSGFDLYNSRMLIPLEGIDIVHAFRSLVITYKCLLTARIMNSAKLLRQILSWTRSLKCAPLHVDVDILDLFNETPTAIPCVLASRCYCASSDSFLCIIAGILAIIIAPPPLHPRGIKHTRHTLLPIPRCDIYWRILHISRLRLRDRLLVLLCVVLLRCSDWLHHRVRIRRCV